MMTHLEATLTILLGNLDQSSRLAGYYNHKVNVKYTKKDDANLSQFRLYSLNLIEVIRELSLGRITIKEAEDRVPDFPKEH